MELTAEHKVLVLTKQRAVLSAQVAVQNAQKQLEQTSDDFNRSMNKLVSDLGIKADEYTLNLDTLELVPVHNPDSV